MSNSNDAFMIEGFVIIGVFVLTWFGMLIRKHKLMSCMPPLAVLFTILVWIQFIIFYYISLPLNMVCSSKDVVLNGQYSLGGAMLQPQAIFSSCRNGSNVFQAEINSNHDTALSLVNGLLSQMLNIDSMLSTDSLSDMVNIPSPADQISSVNNANFSSFNANALNISDSMSFNLSKISTDLTTTVNSLTPFRFDADLGNVTVLDNKLADFNALATTATSPTAWSAWSLNYIEQVFVVPNATFQVSSFGSNWKLIHVSFAGHGRYRKRRKWIQYSIGVTVLQ